MNQTKPKTLEQILKQFDEEDFELGTTIDGDNIEINKPKFKHFLRTEITTLLESLKREDMRDYNDEIDMPSDGYNQRNQELEEDINKILGK